MVDEGTFQSDLNYRLNIFPLTVPRLRKRREEIEVVNGSVTALTKLEPIAYICSLARGRWLVGRDVRRRERSFACSWIRRLGTTLGKIVFHVHAAMPSSSNRGWVLSSVGRVWRAAASSGWMTLSRRASRAARTLSPCGNGW
jgi:hypothetical protein